MTNADDRDYDRDSPDWHAFLQAPGRDEYLALAQNRRPTIAVATIIGQHWPDECEAFDPGDASLCLEQILRVQRFQPRQTSGTDFVAAYGIARPPQRAEPAKRAQRLGEGRIVKLGDITAPWAETGRVIEEIIRVLGQSASAHYDLRTVYDALHLRARCLINPDAIYRSRQFPFIVWDRWIASEKMAARSAP